MNDSWYEIPGRPGYYTPTDKAWKKMLENYDENGKALLNNILKTIKKEKTPTNEEEKLRQ
jgi:hypothetical protein